MILGVTPQKRLTLANRMILIANSGRENSSFFLRQNLPKFEMLCGLLRYLVGTTYRSIHNHPLQNNNSVIVQP